MKAVWFVGIWAGLVLTTTACGDSDSSDAFVPGIPGDPPTVTLSGVPATISTGVPVDFTATVTAPSGLRTFDTFVVNLSGPSSVTDTFDVSEVPGCDAGDTFCSATLSQLIGNPIVFEQPGTVTLTLTAFDTFNASGSQTASIVVQ